LWSPGIRLHVQPGSWFHLTECFGPVLGLIRARDLEEGIRLQNGSAFGLTAGLHSLDEREIAWWKDRVQAGNLYVNRGITGAIVLRQPFGGWKRSCAGPGAKAGGPGYLPQFMRWRSARLPANQRPVDARLRPLLDRLRRAFPAQAEQLEIVARNDAWWWDAVYSRDHDPSGLFCESNVLRYRPFSLAILRSAPETPDEDIARSLLAARCCGVPVELSSSGPRNLFRDAVESATLLREETEAELIDRIRAAGHAVESWVIRAFSPGPALRLAAFEGAARIVSVPVTWHGLTELPHYVREQAASETRHRYGNPLRGQVGRS
jgi:RHH-type proline utilization regulon transcriptional repressor/proline dehydrogenase/delta 1-pyrroline-5-carboxylate dehydrogenase